MRPTQFCAYVLYSISAISILFLIKSFMLQMKIHQLDSYSQNSVPLESFGFSCCCTLMCPPLMLRVLIMSIGLFRVIDVIVSLYLSIIQCFCISLCSCSLLRYSNFCNYTYFLPVVFHFCNTISYKIVYVANENPLASQSFSKLCAIGVSICYPFDVKSYYEHLFVSGYWCFCIIISFHHLVFLYFALLRFRH